MGQIHVYKSTLVINIHESESFLPGSIRTQSKVYILREKKEQRIVYKFCSHKCIKCLFWNFNIYEMQRKKRWCRKHYTVATCTCTSTFMLSTCTRKFMQVPNKTWYMYNLDTMPDVSFCTRFRFQLTNTYVWSMPWSEPLIGAGVVLFSGSALLPYCKPLGWP